MNDKLLIFSEFFLSQKGGGTQKSIINILNSNKIATNYLLITGSKDLDGLIIKSNSEYNIKRISNFKDNWQCIIEIFNSKKLYFNSFFSYKNTIFFLIISLIFRKEIILAPRGELFENNLNLKKKIYIFIFSFIKKNIIFHCTSLAEKYSIKKILRVKENNLVLIRNIIGNKQITINKTLKIRKFIYLSRIDKKKNLLGLCKTLSKFEMENNNEKIYIDIYGHIHDKDYFLKCYKYFEILKHKRIFLKYKKHVNPNNVNKILSNYFVLIHPSLNENFGHIIIEALSCGLQVVASKNIFFNNLKKNNCGFNINFNNTVELHQILLNFIKNNNEEIIKSRNNSHKYFTKFIKDESNLLLKYEKLLC